MTATPYLWMIRDTFLFPSCLLAALFGFLTLVIGGGLMVEEEDEKPSERKSKRLTIRLLTSCFFIFFFLAIAFSLIPDEETYLKALRYNQQIEQTIKQ